MSIFRTYFNKNNTLIDNNLTNSSQNPVTEISYGTLNAQPSRFIFDFDFSKIEERISQGFISEDRIVKHILHLTNTIQYAPEYKGKKSYSLGIERATSFDLDLYNISEEWDEGSGFDIVYDDDKHPKIPKQASNWFERKTDEYWQLSAGSYVSGVTQILATQNFETGDEDIEIDITDYVNTRLGFSGITGYTGNSYGLGLKFPNNLEALETELRQAVNFNTRNTHTFYEPYIETIIDDTIQDDRNYFYLGKDNDIYLYVNIANIPQNITVNSVEIYDYNDKLVTVATGNTITNIKKGIYSLRLNINPDEYPDGVLFRDKWNLTINGKTMEHEDQFYLISSDNYFNFNKSKDIEIDNYFFYFWGIKEKENLRSGEIRKIKLTIKELYPNQNNFVPLDIEYRIYTTVGDKYEIDIVPFTPVDRTNKGYEFDIDTSWLIPQDYKLQLRLRNGMYYENKESVNFTIVSDGIKK